MALLRDIVAHVLLQILIQGLLVFMGVVLDELVDGSRAVVELLLFEQIVWQLLSMLILIYFFLLELLQKHQFINFDRCTTIFKLMLLLLL